MKPTLALRRLARGLNVQTAYIDADGIRRSAQPDVLLPVLRSLGAAVERLDDAPAALAEHAHAAAEPGCEPIVVAWNGLLDRLPVRLPPGVPRLRVRIHVGDEPPIEIATAHLAVDRVAPRTPAGVSDASAHLPSFAGGPRRRGLRLRPSIRLPLGYHRLEIEIDDRTWSSLVIAAPRHAPIDAGAGWGVFLPLHALRTADDWGVGDYGGLDRFITWAGSLGASFTGTLPLLPMFLGAPYEPSPYAPISRRFWGELYIDVAALPFFDADRDVSARMRAQLHACRDTDQVDYRHVAELRAHAIGIAAARFFEAGAAAPDFEAYLREQPEAREYARFRAACDTHRAAWDRWPPLQRHGCLRDADVRHADFQRHLFAAWVADRQLDRVARSAAATGTTIYLDLPLGVHRHGFDTWREPGLFADGVSVGAPPDPLFRGGQEWGFPPMRPAAMRDSGYASLIATLRHHLRIAKLLRLDHVMSVQRLFWIPRGAAARDGVYVRYPMNEMLAVLTLEACRHGAVLIGEDLGTVSGSVRAAMRRHAIQRMFVVQYEADAHRDPPLPDPPGDAMASLNTHDMPPFAAYWKGSDIEDQHARGWITAEQCEAARSLRRRTARALTRQLGTGADRGGADAGADGADAGLARDALHARLAAGPAARTLINLEDLWLEPRPQNVPGTPAGENWRRRAGFDFDAMRRVAEPRLRAIRSIRTP